MQSTKLLGYAQRLQAIAQAGLEYSNSSYDLERYQEIRAISARLLQEITDEPLERIIRAFASESGYQTPKVDVRALVMRGDGVLLVQEVSDDYRWTLPGGWADVGYSPFEVAEKEAQEETGFVVRAVRLLALFDKRKHPHPPQPWYVYKLFILCEETGGQLLQQTSETAGARWFEQSQLPSLELSADRVTLSQLTTVLALADNPALPVLCD